MNNLFSKALEYAVHGYSIIPIGPDKRPLISSWKTFQTTPATEEQIEQWWAQYPHANIGIITGRVSGIIVVDIDTHKGAQDIFPPTYTVETGNKGFQKYYKYTPGFTVSASGYPTMPHVDIRGDGGYVVAPPSVTNYLVKDTQTRAGGLYTVIDNQDLQPFPVDLFAKHKPKKTLKDTIGAPSGKRNDNLTSFIGTLLKSHSEKEWSTTVYAAVERANATYNPPLPLDEVRATFNSVVNLEHNRRAALSGGEDNEEENILRLGFQKNKAEGTFALAQYLVRKFDIITVGEHEYEMYVYQNGLYAQVANEIIYPEIQRVLGPLVTKSAKLETYHKVVDMTMAPRDIFATAPLNLIPLLNGVYDRETRALLPHDSKYRFTYQLPISYDEHATCPRTSDFFDQILMPDQRMLVEEWFGYYFHRNYMFKKALILVGEGDTGKTTLLEVVNFLLGKKNISSVSLQKMAGDKFAAAHMYEKHANLVDELSAKDINDTDNFKIATGGGSISGEYKFGNQFSFNNFSKLTFACNKIPDVKDFDDDAYFNRWMVVRFEKTIEKKIPNFIKTLTTDEERSGLFNLAMRGLDRLLDHGRFSYGKDAMDTKREMMRSGSSIAMFAAECLEQELGGEVSKEDLYEAYTQFCLEKEIPAETIKMVGTKLPFYVTYMSEGLMQGPVFGKRVKGWRNVAIVRKEQSLTALEVQMKKEYDNF